MEIVNKSFKLIPPHSSLCQACAVRHDPGEPHNQQSLHYQYWFYAQYKVWPTWADAMAHCSEEMKTLWIKELLYRGITIGEKQC